MEILSTERLVISKITLNEASFIRELMNDKDWIQNIGDRGVRTLEDAENYIKEKFFTSYDKYGYGFYVIKLKSTKESIGTVGLIDRDGIDGVEIGYGMLPAFRKKGYALEAAQAIFDHARNTFHINKIVAIVNPNNKASIQLLEKLGLTYEKMVRLPEETKDIQYFS